MGAIFFAQWFCPCGQCRHQKVFQTITWLLLSRLQGNKPHSNSPEPSETCPWNLHQHTPEFSGTFREPFGTLRTFRNLPPEPTPSHTGTCRNSPEPASGTYTSTRRNPPELPEPLSGTCSCDPHRHTPELIWAEDPISLKGKNWRQFSQPFPMALSCCNIFLQRELLLPAGALAWE